ncbi:hypothetical protein [Streptomyces sp. SCUT-3]|nr:hypothetical protein [Streptomyces sp. SCUT-3]
MLGAHAVDDPAAAVPDREDVAGAVAYLASARAVTGRRSASTAG